MLGKNQTNRTNITQTIIGQGMFVQGSLKSDGDVIIEGQLNGTVKTSGNVTIGASAVLEAGVVAQNMSISGQVTGNLRVKDTLVITETGKLIGDARTKSLDVRFGAILRGQVTTDDPEKPPKTTGG